MIKDNIIESFAKENHIKVYDITGIDMSTIILKDEKDFLDLVQQHSPQIMYRKYKETTTPNDTNIDIDYDELYQQIEKEYKYLKAVSDILSVDDYYNKLNSIIKKHTNNYNEPKEFIERRLQYSFLFSESCCYEYDYYETEGEESEPIYEWAIISNILDASKDDINIWGQEIVECIKSEFEELKKRLLADKEFAKCKTKDARLLRYDEIIDDCFPYLAMYKNEPNMMRKLPNFYFGFDKKTRSLYAERAYDKLK